MPAHQSESQKSGMALVEMVCMQIEPERPQQLCAAKAENDLLLEPILLVAAIQVVRKDAVLGDVLLQVGVEQQIGIRWLCGLVCT